MNKLYRLLLLSAIALLTACAERQLYVSTSFHEPATDGLRFIYSEDGLHWDTVPGTFLQPKVGRQQVMRDPSIIRTPDGIFHLVWTSSWRGDRGFGYASSRDLVNWSEQRFVEVMDDTATVNVWAPELFWDEEKRQAMVVWASCVPTTHFDLGVEDSLNNHRLYYSVTTDFQTFSPARLLIDPGFSCIDATIVCRAPGDYVMVLKDNTRPNRNIKVCFAPSAEGPWSEPGEPFTGNMMEGPTVTKVGDDYLVYYDRYELRDFGCSKTRDFIEFHDISDDVSVPPLHKHGTIFRAPASIVEGLKAGKGNTQE